MKRVYTLLIIFGLAVGSWAQTQQGIVKTRGRMVDGKLYSGKGLQGATIQIKNRSAIVSKEDGTFSFPLRENNYCLQSVAKKGYQLVDLEICRNHRYSADPLYLVMETPELQQADQLAKERKLRRDLEIRLQQQEDEVENLNVSLEEKNRLLQEINQQRDGIKTIIEDLSKYYSTLDYDQLDEFQRRVTIFLENGQLESADSLLRSRGDIKKRINEIRKEQETEAKEEEELAQRQENLTSSIIGTKKKLEAVAADCYNYHLRFLQAHQQDSAAYYIELRANLDTTNVNWMFDAASFFLTQNNINKSESYFIQILSYVRTQLETGSHEYDLDLSRILNNLAILYSKSNRIKEAENMFFEAISIRRQLAEENPFVYEPYLAQSLNNLATIYFNRKEMSESETMLLEALNIRKSLAEKDPNKYLLDVAVTYSNLAALYIADSLYFEKSEKMYKEALGIYRKLSENKTSTYEQDIAIILFNLSMLYTKMNQKVAGKKSYLEAMDIYSRLADNYPQTSMTFISNMLAMQSKLFIYQDDESDYLHLLSVVRDLAKKHPRQYEFNLADLLNRLGIFYDNNMQTEKGGSCYAEALEIYRKLASEDDSNNRFVANVLGNLSYHSILSRQFKDAESYAKEGLTTDGTKHFIYANLAASILLQGRYQEAESIYKKYRNELKKSFLEDLQKFSKFGLIPKELESDINHIKQLLTKIE